ncbi:MAG: hypothetical protein H6696_09305 [Deferribacteres bacterium]|nr:hypothetical protein [candidate division KSB1 bacterium]MCB9502123.1 hypothetical protein [Deferribacteres bacterium]
MQKLVLLFVTLSLVGCAGSQSSSNVIKAEAPPKTFIRVTNILDTSIHVHLKAANQRPVYLGRIFAHESKNFPVNGLTETSSFSLIAKPIIGQAFKTTMTAPKDAGTVLAWRVGKKERFYNTAE